MPQSRIRRFLKHGTLPQLKAFEAVARLGSFTRAADELHLAQATVSGLVRKLADSAGAPLFESAGRDLALTAAGRALAGASAEMFATLERAARALEALRGDGGRLAVAAEDDAPFAARLLARFAEDHPHLELALTYARREELARRRAERVDDLYLLHGPPAAAPVCEPLREEPLALCARRDHELAGRRALPVARLADCTLLVREPGASTRVALEALLRRHDVRPRRLIEFSSDAAVRDAASCCTGIALLAEEALGDAPLATLDVSGLPLSRRWFVALGPGAAASVAARAFVGLLRADARARDGRRAAAGVGADADLQAA